MRPGIDKGKNIAFVLAAGKGKRMGTDIPKQFLSIHDKPVLYYSLMVFQEHEDIDEIVLVLSEEYKEYPLLSHAFSIAARSVLLDATPPAMAIF